MAEISLMSSSSMKAALLELVPAFERVTGHRVVPRWIGGVELLRRVKDGETADLVFMQASSIDELIELGKVAPGGRVDLAKSGVGAAIRAGDPKPDITTPEALKRALLDAKSIVYSTGPSGVYLIELFQRLGIADELQPKLTQVKGEPTAAIVARGEAEIGFQQVSELLPIPGIDFLGPLPEDLQQITIFSAGVHVEAREPVAAKSLLQFITEPAAGTVIRKWGLEPA